MMTRAFRRVVSAALFTAACLAILSGSQAYAAEEPYEYEPLLSLVGGCATSEVDPVPDPGCPGGTHPPSPFKQPDAVAIDAYGNEYVAMTGNESGTEGRIDIFNDEGFFLGEMPDPHGPRSIAVDNKGTLYVFERVGTGQSEIARYYPTPGYDPEAGEIEYDLTTRKVITTNPSFFGSVAVDSSTNRLFAMFAYVEEYASVDELSSPDEANPLLNEIKERDFHSSAYVAVDGQRRRVFVSSCKNESKECGVLVFKADPPYELIGEVFEFNGSTRFISQQGLLSIAVDEETGHFFVQDIRSGAHSIYEFDANFEYVETIEHPFLEVLFLSQIAVSNSGLNPDAANHRVLFTPIASPSGKIQEVFAFKPEKIGRPNVEGGEALHISQTEGEIKATIDPNGALTTYAVTIEEEGSGEVRTVGGGTIPNDSLPRRITATFANLRPGARYRFKVEASNVQGADAEEGSFSTYSDAPLTVGACPNEDLRAGPSSSLPDCRAFELVTPADTNGGPPRGGGYLGDLTLFSPSLVSPDGNAITFMSESGPLPGFEGTGSVAGDRYRVSRGDSGWTTVRFGPTGTESETPRFNGTSPEQGFGLWDAEGDGTAVIGGFGHRTSYLEFPDGHDELVGIGSLGVDSWAVGKLLTENASHLIFQTQSEEGRNTAVQLEPDAPAGGTGVVYDRTSDGITHVVSLLPPDNSTPAPGEDAVYVGASRDGTGIAFEIGDTLYLRSSNTETHEIGKNVAFAGVAEGGHRIFYVEGDDLLAYDTDRNEVIEFTKTGNAKVVNVAPSGQRAYFASTTVITGAGRNPLGARPQAGQQNLYLSEEGDVRFVGIVTKRDVEGESVGGYFIDGLGLWAALAEGGNTPSLDPSRVDPDGSTLVFQSRANLDGGGTGGAVQIYRYNSEDDRLQCISCNPTGTPEGGGASLATFGPVPASLPPIGVKISILNLSPDGRRVVFESKEALVSTDNDAVQDIYEWEEDGVGSCTRAGGCVYLLSSGHSARDNFLYGMSRSADDVFFVTSDTLVPGDSSTPSIYDARVGGGFPRPVEDICVGEGCRPGISAAPVLTSPGSPARGAHDNVKPRKCPKGKRKVKRQGKVRCVRKHHRHHHKHRTAGKKKGAAR